MLLSARLGLHYQFDLNGAAVNSLTVGKRLTVLEAYIRDNRGSSDATGVLQAYFNVNYSTNVVSIPAGQGVTPGADYDWAATGNNSTPGTIGAAGGESTYRIAPSPANTELLLYSVPFYASNAGTLTLTTAVDAASGNTVIQFFPHSNPPTVTNMADVEVDGLASPTLSANGSTVTGTFQVLPATVGAATHFVVSTSSSATAGSPINVTVTAEDQYNNTATGYAGTVHFSSNDPSAVLPANATLTSGVATFSATLKTAGSQAVTATDATSGSIAGTSGTVRVTPAAATHFLVAAPASATAGSAVTFTATAKDSYNNTATGYAGTVHFTSSDPLAVLPANATLTSGVATFSATLKTAGNETITATDIGNASIAGVSGAVRVSAAVATYFLVAAPASAVAGSPFLLTVTAKDQYNNTATSYASTVHFTSSDVAAALPANATMTGGAGTFSVTLKAAGSRTVTVTDIATGSIIGTSPAVSVSAAAATHFVLSAPPAPQRAAPSI